MKDLAPTKPRDLKNASDSIRALVTNAEIPKIVREELTVLREQLLPGVTVIVRSSAVGEDSASASFAGQLDSYLNVGSQDEIERALLACWASCWSERSLFYQLARKIPLNGMGVVIQEMVKPKLSGVLFTKPPGRSAGEDDALLGEYCFGHGEVLVSGKINPGRFSISRADLRWRQGAEPEQPEAGSDESLFNEDCMVTLARAGLLLEQLFECPQDIEWTIDDTHRLWLVQSRPITAAAAAYDKPPAQPQDAAPAVLWTNANVSENFPDPITPLLYAIASTGYYYYFRHLARAFGISRPRILAMEQPLRNIIGVHGARMYYNLTNIHAVLRAAPFGDRLAESFNQFVGATQTTRSRSVAGWSEKSRLAQLSELFVIIAKTTGHYLFLEQRVAAFERTGLRVRRTDEAREAQPTLAGRACR